MVGTSKMRMVHSLISPRKRIQSKTTSKQGEGTKLGDGTKHGAEQGTSNPKPPINKLKILMDYKHEEVRARVMVLCYGFFISVILISSLSNIWFLWLSISLSSLYWPRAPFMVLLWNKVGGSGSWVSCLQCFWLNQLKENHVKGYAGGVQGRWKHRELFVFGIKLEVAEYKHYIFLWSAWDDTSGSMTSLSQSIWYVYRTVESNTRGEGDDLISSMSRSWQARQ